MFIVWENDRAGREAESAFLTFLVLFLKSIPQRGASSSIQMMCLEETWRKICLLPERICRLKGTADGRDSFVRHGEEDRASRSPPTSAKGGPHPRGTEAPERTGDGVSTCPGEWMGSQRLQVPIGSSEED